MKKAIFSALVIAISFGFISCAGYTPQVQFPSYITKVAVPIFMNKTDRNGIEQYITQKSIDQFIADGKVSITDEQTADAVVKCAIEQYILIPITYDTNQVPQQYRLKIKISLYFFDNKNQRKIWDEPNLWEDTTYYVVNNLGMPAETEEIARTRLMDKLAERVFRRVIYGW
jgi:hypothetical protein